MKRGATFLMTVALVFSLAVPAAADVLWEPSGNSFYEKNRDEMDYLGRRYTANSPEGFITAWDAPDGSVVKGQFENGQELWIYWVYENWGLISHYAEDREVEGWVDLDEMTLVYDYQAFAQEYADRITPYGEEFADYSGDAAGVAFYEYPGAPQVKIYWNFQDFAQILDNLRGNRDNGSYIQSIFVDEQGLTWGFVGYMYGRTNAWFCLDNPEGDGDPNETVGEGESVFPVRPVEPEEEIVPAREPELPAKGYLPYALVAAVVAVTGSVLAVFFRKKKKK